jgi:DNA-binding NarL/FixJ family response regulator
VITVLLVDDEELVRFGLRTVLEAAGDFEVVGEAGNGADGVAAARELRPDVVLIDIRMPVMDGLTATQRILALPDPPQVAVLTTFHLDEYVYAALAAGAAGFLLKDTAPDELLDAIRVVASGEGLLGRGLTGRVLKEFAAQPAPAEPAPELDILSDREREVLQQIANGLTNEEIAGALHLSPATAKTYVHRIMTKLQARDRVQLVIFAYDKGLVRPRPQDR